MTNTGYSEKNAMKAFRDAVPSLMPNKNSYYLTRIVLVRFLAFIYGLLSRMKI